jgi:CheY-like chemotaxis protein
MAQKLLLADDSVTIQRVIELTFADENIQVIAVGDGQQAIARIDSEHPDVVLADIGMPERDGYEVAAHVKGNPATAHIPVLLLTGAFEPIDEARARAVGCDGVLVKPFEPQMVINRVKDLLAGRRPASLWSTPPGPAVTPQGGATSAVSVTPMGAPSKPEAPGTPRPEPAAAPPESKSGESLDDYFDRLDAAFSTEGQPASGAQFDAPIAAAPAPPSIETREEFGAWDIQTEPAGASAPAPNAAAFSEPAPPRPAPAFEPSTPPANELPTIAPEMSPVAQAPALADAFAALLAAEQKVGPSASGTGAPLDEQAIEDIVRRVLARMSDDVVRSTVLELAERLVRDEIDRIKRQANL